MMDDTAQALLNDWDDLYDRLERAAEILTSLCDDASTENERVRLGGKVEGVKVALHNMASYPDRRPGHPPSGHPVLDSLPVVKAPRGPVEFTRPTMGDLPIEWGERAIRFIGLLLTVPGMTLLPNERADLDQLVSELDERRT